MTVVRTPRMAPSNICRRSGQTGLLPKLVEECVGVRGELDVVLEQEAMC